MRKLWIPVIVLLMTRLLCWEDEVHAKNGGQVRTYYIAVDEIEWDYAPLGIDEMTGKPFDQMTGMFVEQNKTRIGRTYRKAVYREYTDDSFTTLKVRPTEWQH